MTTEELCQRVAEIEGWDIVSYPDNHSGCSNHMFIKDGIMHSARSFCFRLIERYKLDVTHGCYIDEDTGGTVYTGGVEVERCTSFGWLTIKDKDLLTAVFKAVIEVNK